MTFKKQVKEAKNKQLENRLFRDIIFIILGITFLIISFVSAYKNNKIEEEKKVSINRKNSFISNRI